MSPRVARRSMKVKPKLSIGRTIGAAWSLAAQHKQALVAAARLHKACASIGLHARTEQPPVHLGRSQGQRQTLWAVTKPSQTILSDEPEYSQCKGRVICLRAGVA